MGKWKKKNIVIVTVCVIFSFIIYQLYFFVKITSETANSNQVVPILDQIHVQQVLHLRSDADKFINEDGVIRGALRQNMVKYRPDAEEKMKCLNSEQRIKFTQFNDDYCDCKDGTDEPSTSACPNGTFYCDFQYVKKMLYNSVPSGKVNDGICDCCDGSDEFAKTGILLLSQGPPKLVRKYVDKCPNVC